MQLFTSFRLRGHFLLGQESSVHRRIRIDEFTRTYSGMVQPNFLPLERQTEAFGFRPAGSFHLCQKPSEDAMKL